MHLSELAHPAVPACLAGVQSSLKVSVGVMGMLCSFARGATVALMHVRLRYFGNDLAGCVPGSCGSLQEHANAIGALVGGAAAAVEATQ